ncbi:MAG: hypothetical protein ACT6RD_00865 [Brevundimonas sp.]|uniref:hypothetical protein n=1 Tax=Brevundimonas sp. TaxID=1871086 RepID=UPI0040337302
MKKNTLLLAVSAAALAVGATNSFAADISGTLTAPGGTATLATASASALKLSNQATYYASATSSAVATQGTLVFNLLSSSPGGFPNGESLRLDMSLSGAIFTGAATVAGSTATCSASVSIQNGAAANGTSASYFVNLQNCVTSGTGVTVSVPVQITSSTSVSSVTAGLTGQFGGSPYQVEGATKTAFLVAPTQAYAVTIAATGTASVANVSNGYQGFVGSATGAVVATATVSVDTSVRNSLATTATAAPTDVQGVDLTVTPVTGSFTGFTIESAASGNALATDTATTSGTALVFEYDTATAATSTYTINPVDLGTATTGGVIPATSVTLKADVDLVNGLNDLTTTTPVAFNVVTRNGTNFVAPWIGLGANGVRSQIRLGNNSSIDTGPITVRVLSRISGATTATVSTYTVTSAVLGNGQSLTGLGGIPANTAISIDGSKLKDAIFGTASINNADIEISIEAQPQNISGKVRLVDSVGVVTETSLGNLAGPIS